MERSLKNEIEAADKKLVMEQLMTVKEVGALLRITPQTIYKMVEDKRLPAIKVGKQWRFERGAIRQWINGNGNGNGNGTGRDQ